jgi:hypothetical protein
MDGCRPPKPKPNPFGSAKPNDPLEFEKKKQKEIEERKKRVGELAF